MSNCTHWDQFGLASRKLKHCSSSEGLLEADGLTVKVKAKSQK